MNHSEQVDFLRLKRTLCSFASRYNSEKSPPPPEPFFPNYIFLSLQVLICTWVMHDSDDHVEGHPERNISFSRFSRSCHRNEYKCHLGKIPVRSVSYQSSQCSGGAIMMTVVSEYLYGLSIQGYSP
jgi:hypothetical protein